MLLRSWIGYGAIGGKWLRICVRISGWLYLKLPLCLSQKPNKLRPLKGTKSKLWRKHSSKGLSKFLRKLKSNNRALRQKSRNAARLLKRLGGKLNRRNSLKNMLKMLKLMILEDLLT